MKKKPTYEELEQRVKELEGKMHERKRAEEEIAKLGPAVAQSIDGIAIGDLEPKLISVNDAFARMHGYAPHEMVGMKVKHLHNPEQMEAFTKGIHEIKTQASWIGEIGHIRKDSTPFPTYMSVTLLKDDKGKPTGILAVCRDITERKRAEETLKAAEAQKQALLDASVDRIRLVDLDMKIIWANKTTTKEVNIAPEELVGQYCFEVLVGRHTPCPRCPTKKALKSGHIEHAVIHRDPSKGAKREAYWDNYAVPIKNESGDIVSLVQITRNITKQKLAERALKEREKELKIKTNTLSELNAALRVLIEGKDNDRLETEQKVLFNVKELVIPFLERLKKTPLTSEQLAYLHILESNFNDIISPFSRTLSSKYLSLTPTEIQVANLVKDGKTSQEIAEVMNLSRRTVESHRDGIRKKLGLKNRKANLRSHLLSI
ncbi:MAG: PAS domain S-box protein [Proteobacteria bacterium]|nr:PAS domain S-box protein [Pseudomonadota bacterium]